MIRDIVTFLFAVSPLLIRIWYVLYINPPIDPVTYNALDDLDTNFGFMSKTFYMKSANDPNTLPEFMIKPILLVLLIICAIVRYFALYGPSWQQVMHEFPGGREGFNTCLFANTGE